MIDEPDTDSHFCDCCHEDFDTAREYCGECEQCQEYCTCEPYDERAEHGTYH